MMICAASSTQRNKPAGVSEPRSGSSATSARLIGSRNVSAWKRTRSLEVSMPRSSMYSVSASSAMAKTSRERLKRSRGLVKRAELRVLACSDEYEPAGRDDRSAIQLGTGRRHAARFELGELAQRNSPAILARIEVDRAQRAPRRCDGWMAGRIAPALVADELVARCGAQSLRFRRW